MTIELINPEELTTPESYSQVAIATGQRLIFIAGQVAEDADGNIVGPDDLAVQAQKAFSNLGRALAAAGARPQDVAKITIYVVNLEIERWPEIEMARAEVFGDHKPVDTVVGVETLAYPAALIEVEAMAVM